jgi:predicted RNA-binding Zn-ribbon protein involved in translation (DUF1610 family)
MTGEVTRIDIDEEFRVCPNCGYELGFHNMFEKIGQTNELSWKFICPNCSKTYDLGLKVKLE